MAWFFDIHGGTLFAELRRGINKIPFAHVQYSPQVLEKNYRITQKKVIRDLGLVFLLLPRQNGGRCKDTRFFLNTKNADLVDPIVFFHDFNTIPNYLHTQINPKCLQFRE